MRGTVTPLRSGPYSVTLPDTAGPLTIPAEAAGGGLSNDLLPWIVNVDVLMTAVSQTNWNTLTVNTSAVHNGYKSSSGAQNDTIAFDVVLAAGTWTFELVYVKDTANGIFSVRINDVEKGTIDSYAASASYNNRSQITSIAISTSGKVRLSLVMATKNGSASDYTGSIQHIQFKRTA